MHELEGEMAEIWPRLYLGSIAAALCPELLSQHRVTRVVDLANMMEAFPIINGTIRADGRIYETQGDESVERRLAVRIEDKEEYADALDDLFEHINAFVHTCLADQHRVLIHCFEGKSRSATTVIQYLMRSKKLTLAEAHERTATRRAIRLNNGFKKVLMALDSQLYPDKAPTVVLEMTIKPTLSKGNARIRTRGDLDKQMTRSSQRRNQAMKGRVKKALVSRTLSTKTSDAVGKGSAAMAEAEYREASGSISSPAVPAAERTKIWWPDVRTHLPHSGTPPITIDPAPSIPEVVFVDAPKPSLADLEEQADLFCPIGSPEFQQLCERAQYHKWPEALRFHSFPTRILQLSVDEIQQLRTAESVQDISRGLERRLRSAVEALDGEGVFIKVGLHSARDAVLGGKLAHRGVKLLRKELNAAKIDDDDKIDVLRDKEAKAFLRACQAALQVQSSTEALEQVLLAIQCDHILQTIYRGAPTTTTKTSPPPPVQTHSRPPPSSEEDSDGGEVAGLWTPRPHLRSFVSKGDVLDCSESEESGSDSTGKPASLCIYVRKFENIDPMFEFRGVVANRQLTGLSQYFSFCHFWDASNPPGVVIESIRKFYAVEVKQHLKGWLEWCILDFAILSSGKIIIVDINPFHYSTSAALFDWASADDREILLRGPFEWRYQLKPNLSAATRHIAPAFRTEISAWRADCRRRRIARRHSSHLSSEESVTA